MMPSCNAQGVEGSWQKPSADNVNVWLANFMEDPTREEKDLIRDTADEEVAYIASRTEEAMRFAGASGSRSAVAEDEEEHVNEEPAGEYQEEPAGEHEDDVAGDTEQEELPTPKKKTRIL